MEQPVVFNYTYSPKENNELKMILEKYLPYIEQLKKVEHGDTNEEKRC